MIGRGGRVVQSKPIPDASQIVLVRNRIDAILERDKRNRPMWGKLASKFGRPKSRGYLSQVYNGYRSAPNWLRIALGLHPLHVPVDPCPTCGMVTVAETCPVCHPPKPKRHRKPDPVVRVARVDAARIAALAALYDGRVARMWCSKRSAENIQDMFQD